MHTFTVQYLPNMMWYRGHHASISLVPIRGLSLIPRLCGRRKVLVSSHVVWQRGWQGLRMMHVSMPLCMATGGMWPLRKTLQYPHVYNNTIIAVFQGYYDDVDTTITTDKSNFKWNRQMERLLLGNTCKSEVRQKLCLKYSGNCTHNRAAGGISLMPALLSDCGYFSQLTFTQFVLMARCN